MAGRVLGGSVVPYEVIESRGRLLGRLVETAGLFVLLTVIGLRPLIGESYDLAGLSFTAALEGLSDPLPLHTLLLDVAILAGAAAWAIGHGLQPQWRYRWSGLEVGWILVLVASIVSCVFAHQKRVAINGAVDWVAMATIPMVLTQVLRERRIVRLTLCVIVASAAVQAYRCFDQSWVTFPETERMYQERREAFWQAQGVPLDSAQVVSFERRMQAREASGYLAHSNVAGAYLGLAFFAALGMAARRWERGATWDDRAVFLAILAVAGAFFGAMLLTHSRGAVVACVGGLAVAALRFGARRWFDVHRLWAWILGWGLIAGGVLAVVGHGWHHGGLPSASLNFRWAYWTASSRLIADHAWTGVGRENFGDAYLRYKTIAAPEEVKNPHNFLVTAAAEWGIPGLVGVLAMLIGASFTVTRPLADTISSADGAKSAIPATGHPRLWMLLLAVSFFGIRLRLLGSDNPDFLFVETVVPAMAWLGVFALGAYGPDPWRRSGREGWLRLAVLINCGLFAFLLQDTINFALLVPGAATAFFALVGVAIAARQVPPPRRSVPDEGRTGPARWGFAVAAFAGLLFVGGGIIPPVWRATYAVEEARQSRANPVTALFEDHPAYRRYQEALRDDPFDPTPAVELSDWLQTVASSGAGPERPLRAALAASAEAIARSPDNAGFHRRRAQLALTLARVTQSADDRATALVSAQRALELYPTRPGGYADLAAVETWTARSEDRPLLMRSAIEHYRRALALDAERPAWEEIRRFRPAQVAEIQALVAECETWLAGRPG